MKNNPISTSSRRPSASIADVVEEELTWFFAKYAENFDRESFGDDDEEHVQNLRSYRHIEAILREISNFEAGVLKAAYTPGPWAQGLVEALGRTTGVVVRLASSDGAWPEDPAEQQKLEARVAESLEKARVERGRGAFERYFSRAAQLLAMAIGSYTRKRGRGPSAVKTGLA